MTTAYLSEPPGDEDAASGQEEDQPVSSLDSVLNTLPAAAVSMEMSPPQPSIARSLRLSPGQPVITVTARFDDAITGEPAGLTVVVLRPELFRVEIDTTEAPAGTRLAALWVAAGFSIVTTLRLSRLSSGATALSWRCRARQPGHARGGPGTLGAETPAEVVTEAG